MKKALPDWLYIAGGIVGIFLGLGVLFYIGDTVRAAFPRVNSPVVSAFVYVLAGVCIIGGVTKLIPLKWNQSHRARRFIVLYCALIALGIVLAKAISDPDSDCSIDWDGRSNPIECGN